MVEENSRSDFILQTPPETNHMNYKAFVFWTM